MGGGVFFIHRCSRARVSSELWFFHVPCRIEIKFRARVSSGHPVTLMCMPWSSSIGNVSDTFPRAFLSGSNQAPKVQAFVPALFPSGFLRVLVDWTTGLIGLDQVAMHAEVSTMQALSGCHMAECSPWPIRKNRERRRILRQSPRPSVCSRF